MEILELNSLILTKDMAHTWDLYHLGGLSYHLIFMDYLSML